MIRRFGTTALAIVVTGFILTEIILMLMPSAPRLGLGSGGAMAIFVASVVLTLGVLLVLISSWKPDKS